MDWKDTVMSNEQLEANIREDFESWSIKEEPDAIQDILIWTREAQAEISFKAGEKEMFNKLLRNPTEPKAFDWALDGNEVLLLYDHERLSFEGKKTGINEVVDAVKIYDKNYSHTEWGDESFRESILGWINSKKKEWGL